MDSTLSDFVASQDALVQEASLALPYTFDSCTYAKGALRQPVYLCTTCATPRGLCQACSVACHTDHEQLELFPKRAFRCDCPTRALSHPCTLHRTLEEPNEENAYGQNFRGAFCRCGRAYDAMAERETMIQCLACEDWFHESCLNLRERPDSAPPSPAPAAENENRNGEENEDDDDASSSGLPPPLISAADYDAMVCSACVRAFPLLRRYAGTPGAKMVVRDSSDQPWRIAGEDKDESDDVAVEGGSVAAPSEVNNATTARKRSRSPSSDSVDPKRIRVGSPQSGLQKSLCLAPVVPQDSTVKSVFERIDADPSDISLGAGDLFLAGDWRTRWCKCTDCAAVLSTAPYLLEEEETYEPPEDPDSGRTLEELGMRALQHLPRDRAIDGIRAFNEMRDGLMAYLRPFASEGKTVSEADIHKFFEERRKQ